MVRALEGAAIVAVGAAILVTSRPAEAGDNAALLPTDSFADWTSGGWDGFGVTHATSQEGIDRIRTLEGLRLTAYQDVRDRWTIGYGHTGPDVYGGLVINREQAEGLLAQDVADAAAAVNRLVLVPITQSMFDALVSFTFNVGVGNLESSTLLRKLNAGDYSGAAAEFSKWVYAGGTILSGLVVRRDQEASLFRSGLVAL